MSSLDAIKNFRFTKKQFIVVYWLVLTFSTIIFVGDYSGFFEAQKGGIGKELTHLGVTVYLAYLFYFKTKDYLMGYLVLHVVYVTVVEMLNILEKLSLWYCLGIIVLAVLGLWHIKNLNSSA